MSYYTTQTHLKYQVIIMSCRSTFQSQNSDLLSETIRLELKYFPKNHHYAVSDELLHLESFTTINTRYIGYNKFGELVSRVENLMILILNTNFKISLFTDGIKTRITIEQ